MATNGTSAAVRRGQVMVGDLPEDFLRVITPASHSSHAAPSRRTEQQIAADHQAAAYLQAAQSSRLVAPQAAAGGASFATPVTRLSITVAQARLNKNYGLVKMDPYCRVRIGHSVFETHTAGSGGKNPIWNKVIHSPLPAGVDFVYLEIFDEHSFSMDDRIAWAHIPISERVWAGETVDEWYPLNGKLGDDKEGAVNLVLSLTKVQAVPGGYGGQPVLYALPGGGVQQVYAPLPHQPTPAVGVPVQNVAAQGPRPLQPGQQQPASGSPGSHVAPAAPRGPAFTDEDVATVKEMFPNIDEEVVRSVLEVNRGDKDATINNLLTMDIAA